MKTMTDAELKAWNETFPVGSPCVVTMIDGSEFQSITVGKAFRGMPGGIIICVMRASFYFDLDRVKMMEAHKL